MNEPISHNLFAVCLVLILVSSAFLFSIKLNFNNIKKIIKEFIKISKDIDNYDSMLDNLSFKLSINIICKLSYKYLELILKLYSSVELLRHSILGIKEIVTTKTVPYSTHINIILIFELAVFLPVLCIFIFKKFYIILKNCKKS